MLVYAAGFIDWATGCSEGAQTNFVLLAYLMRIRMLMDRDGLC